MRRWVEFVLRHRYAVIALWLSVTGVAAWSASRAEMSTRLGEDMIGDRPEFAEYLERSSNFRSDGTVIVGIEDPDMLRADHIERLERACELLLLQPEIAHVTSILDAQRLESVGPTLRTDSYVDVARTHPESLPELVQDIRSDPLVGPLFLSADGTSHALLIEYTVDGSRTGEAATALVDMALDPLLQAGYQREQLHVTGFIAAIAESVVQLHFNVKTVFPIVSVILILFVWLLFRRLWPALVSLAVSMTAVIWTVGFLVALEGRVHTLVSLTPPVILIVAFSDVVHLCSAYLMALGRDLPRREAILTAGAEVGKACLLTSATTFAGFASFGLVPQPAMQATAIALAFGVAVALLIALTLTPVLFSFGKRPAPLRRGATAMVHRDMDRLLDGSRRLAFRRPWTIILAFGALAVFSAIGAPQFTFDADFYKRFDERNALTRDAEWFNSQFPGTNLVELYVEGDKQDALIEPETFRAIVEFEAAVEALPFVESATSVTDLILRIHRAMAPDRAARDPVPDSRELLAQYFLLFESAGGDELDRIIDFDRREMVIGLRLNQAGARFTAREGLRLQAMARDVLPDNVEAETSGIVYLLGFFFEEILQGQMKGLALSFILIALLMSLGLKSMRVGLLSMLPNLLPLLAVVGFLGWGYDHVDSDVIVILVIAIGIGVDDTIHFLSRFRLEMLRTNDTRQAVDETFAFAGRGIFMTTVILVAGFLPCALSSYVTMWYLGTLLPLALVIALAADLLLVPALVFVGFLRFSIKSDQ